MDYKLFTLIFILPLLFLLPGILARAGDILVSSSTIASASLVASMDTYHWGGIYGYITSGTVDETPQPLAVRGVVAGVIDQVNISASSLFDGKHYIAVLPEIGPINSTYAINTANIANITEEDLEAWGLFNESNFPIFHPDYYLMSDNPKSTFCCLNDTLMISGEIYNPYVITLRNNVKYYLLRYNYNSTFSVPIFIVNMSTAYSCWDYSSCHYELMLPADTTYNIYIIPREPAYDIRVWVDGVETLTIPKTARPYNITVYVYNKYTLQPAPNKTVVIFEDSGNEIVSPYFSAGTQRVLTLGVSDSNGIVQFIVAPTATATEASVYVLGAGLYWPGGEITAQKFFTITDMELSSGKKYISPSELLDNSKATVVTMAQVEDSLYNWAKNAKALKYTLYVYNNGTYYCYNLTDLAYYPTCELKTGAVNYISVILRDASTNLDISGTVVPKEVGGLILMNPTYNPPYVGAKQHIHEVLNIPTGQGFVITPTKIGEINSNTTFEVYDSLGNKVAEVAFNINKDSTISAGALYYNNDAMKAKIVKTLQVIDTLYYAYW